MFESVELSVSDPILRPSLPITEVSETRTEVNKTGRALIADKHVGARVRERRITLGMSQQQLAVVIGVTCQQVHKYERGLNRIAASRLYDVAVALDVSVSWFFEGLGDAQEPPAVSPRQRMCLDIARNFSAIDNERYQAAVSHMVRTLATDAPAIERD